MHTERTIDGMRFVVLFLLVARTALADCDMSTDAAARKAYARVTGNRAPEACFARSRTFTGLVTVGAFANDRGCIWRSLFYQCRLDAGGEAARAMAAAGWPLSNDAKRLALIRAWITEVEHLEIVDRRPEKWDPHTPWSAPATSREGAVTHFKFWQQWPAGMNPETRYSLTDIAFDANGVPGAPHILHEVAVR